MKKRIIRILAVCLSIAMTPFPAFAVNDDYIPIQIDGYYDDWEDKPHTEVYPGNNPPASKINYVSLFRDEDNAYIHVIYARKNNQDITNMRIELFTNLGDEDYFITPDFFWPSEEENIESEGIVPSVEPDAGVPMEPDTSAPAEPDANAPSEPDANAPAEPDANAPAEPDTNAPAEPDANAPSEPDAGTNGENLLAGADQKTYLLVADNEKKDNTPIDTTTVTTDEKSNNGQGNGSDKKEDTDTIAPDAATDPFVDPAAATPEEDAPVETDPGNLLDILNPENLVDLNDVMEQFEEETQVEPAIDPSAVEIQESVEGIDLNSNLDIKKEERYGTWGFTIWDGLTPVGSGYYTRTEGAPDEMECYIPLSSITHDYDGITEISMRIKKLGPQYIMSTGASTGAYIGVVAGAGIAMLSAGAYSYRKKKPLALNKDK